MNGTVGTRLIESLEKTLLFGRESISDFGPVFLAGLLGLAVHFLQSETATGQNPSVASEQNLPINGPPINGLPINGAPNELQFEKTQLDLSREGYASLTWNVLPGAAIYQVTDAAGKVRYAGALPECFVSGLADGSYQFQLTAIDGSGQVIAKAEEPAVLTVSHWPLGYALIAFAVGLTVMCFVVGMIVVGTRSTSPSRATVSPEVAS